ncbi:MAG: hypothetical protein AB1589_29625 [Cyanobacteriota bacterium]
MATASVSKGESDRLMGYFAIAHLSGELQLTRSHSSSARNILL